MTRVSCSQSGADKRSLVDHYERLRTRVLSGRIREVRDGLAVMLQKGMAAWMQLCSPCREIDRKKHLYSIEKALPDEQYGALIDLFTNMAMNQMKEVFI